MNGEEFDNPSDLFEKIRDAGEDAVLLQSGLAVQSDARSNSDYLTSEWSFIGIINPEIKVPKGEEGLFFMREFVKKNRRDRGKNDPPFSEGFVGFLSYDLGEKWLGIKKEAGIKNGRRSVACPEAYFVYVDRVVAFRNSGRGRSAVSAVSSRESRLAATLLLQQYAAAAPRSNLTKEEYVSKIAKIKDHLYAGDTYQVNFSQKFQAAYNNDAFGLYKKLTAINPSPFQFFLETPEFAVISNSPERLFRITFRPRHGGAGDIIIETRPIKGTVPRGKTPKEDEQNIQKLLASEKDRAELAMIVDLERNDIGKVCVPGTIEVTEERTIEKYSHVIHTVSNVMGVMEDRYDWFDALKALFPGGSITGCPKKRTMEIIRELEDEPRGVYCGSAGYIDLSGECDFNIMIRTAFFDKEDGHAKITYRTGGGIVVDSKPESEYEESINKAEAFLESLT